MSRDYEDDAPAAVYRILREQSGRFCTVIWQTHIVTEFKAGVVLRVGSCTVHMEVRGEHEEYSLNPFTVAILDADSTVLYERRPGMAAELRAWIVEQTLAGE